MFAVIDLILFIIACNPLDLCEDKCSCKPNLASSNDASMFPHLFTFTPLKRVSMIAINPLTISASDSPLKTILLEQYQILCVKIK